MEGQHRATPTRAAAPEAPPTGPLAICLAPEPALDVNSDPSKAAADHAYLSLQVSLRIRSCACCYRELQPHSGGAHCQARTARTRGPPASPRYIGLFPILNANAQICTSALLPRELRAYKSSVYDTIEHSSSE